MKLQNYVQGKWVDGKGDGVSIFNSIDGGLEQPVQRKVLILKRSWHMAGRWEARHCEK